jgi:hypothetical protein
VTERLGVALDVEAAFLEGEDVISHHLMGQQDMLTGTTPRFPCVELHPQALQLPSPDAWRWRGMATPGGRRMHLTPWLAARRTHP